LFRDGFFGGFERSCQKLGVGADAFKKFPVDDESVLIFSKEQRVAVFHFGSAFSSYEDFRTWFVDAENFVLVGDATFANDAFVGLLDGLGEEVEDVIDALDDGGGLAGAEVGFESPMFFKKVAVRAGVAGHAAGKFLKVPCDFFALGFAVFAAPGVAEGDEKLIEVVKEFVGTAFGHAVFDAVFSDAAGSLEKGAAAVAELDPVDGKMDVGAVAGGVIPDAVEVGGIFKSEEVDGFFKYGIVLIWSGGGFLKKHGEGPIQDFCAEVILGPVDGAFAGGLDLVEVFEEAEPLFERAVGEGDFEIASRSASLVSPQDSDAEGAAGVLDEAVEASVEGLVVFSLLAALFENLIENEVIQSALM